MRKKGSISDVIRLYEKQRNWLIDLGLISCDGKIKFVLNTYFYHFIADHTNRRPQSVRKIIQDYEKHPDKYKYIVTAKEIRKRYQELRDEYRVNNIAGFIPFEHYVEEVSILFNCKQKEVADIIREYAKHRNHIFGKSKA